MDINDMPYFYADTATRKGMSGSPVVLYKDRPATIISESKGLMSSHITKLIGIYSGRIGVENNLEGNAQLGRVWKAGIFKNIIAQYEP